jgi:hypothetical protein
LLAVPRSASPAAQKMAPMRRRANAPGLLLAAGAAALVLNLCASPTTFFGPGGPEPVSENARAYRLDNSKLQSPGGGVSYRNSKNEGDMAQDGAPWDTVVMGEETGDGWLKIGDKYLPMTSGGVPILVPATDEDGRQDWKDEAWKRQQMRLQARRQRASPDFQMSAEEKLLRQRKKAVWKVMSTRDSEGLLQADGRDIEDGRLITVELSKPLGINFMEIDPNNPCGALIGELAAGMSAAQADTLDIGDVLVSVNGKNIYGKPMDEAVQPIIDAEGEIKLVFFRANLD